MSKYWDSYVSEGEKVLIEFGISNIYATGMLAIITILAVIIGLTNVFVGVGVLLLGILYWVYFTQGKRYALTNKQIILVESFLGKSIVNVKYKNITDISVEQNAIDLIGGWGTVIINTAGTTFPEAILQNISNPYDIKNKINSFSEHH